MPVTPFSRRPRSTGRRALLTAAAGLAVVRPLPAQTGFPSRPMRVIVPAAPGGGTDAIARLWAEQAGALLRQPITVENRAGGNAVIGTEALARSAPDGHVLALVQNAHTGNAALIRKLPYDTITDFTAIAPIARSPLVLVASGATGVKSVADLLELARRDPKAATFGYADASTRIATEMLRGATRIPIALVAYKGTGPAMADVAGGHLNFTVTTIASTLPYRAGGKATVIAVLAPARTPFLPEVATLAEQGLPGIEAAGWWGLVGPAGIARDIVAKLAETTAATLAAPEMRKRLEGLSAQPWSESPEGFERFIRDDVALTTRIARQAGIEPE